MSHSASTLMRRAASSVESHNMRADGDEQFMRCNICGMPDHDEMGAQHTELCFITQLRLTADKLEKLEGAIEQARTWIREHPATVGPNFGETVHLAIGAGNHMHAILTAYFPNDGREMV